MNIIQGLDLMTTVELGITSVLVYIITAALKKSKLNNIWLPWVAMAAGAVVGLVAVATAHDTNWLGGAVAGVMVGGFTAGLFDGLKGTVIAVTNRKDKVATLQATVDSLTAKLDALSTDKTGNAASDEQPGKEEKANG